jgi:hypothetical protein
LFVVGYKFDEAPVETWRHYNQIFRAYSTRSITPELLNFDGFRLLWMQQWQLPSTSQTEKPCMTFNVADHGLPLVALSLKEQRRDLIMALRGSLGPMAKDVIRDIAAIQAAIAAMEAVICDLDDEILPIHGSFESSRLSS